MKKFQKTFSQGNDLLRIISLGGFGDVTQNMFVYELAPQGDFSRSQIIIVDCGTGFPEEDTFGVDLQIPDTTYLQDKKDRILGMFITHGHEDHIGAIRFVLNLLGNKFPIYAPKLAAAFIESRLAEFNLHCRLNLYNEGQLINCGPFTIEPVRVTHSIPDTFHLAIHLPLGICYHGSDFKFDLFPLDGQATDLAHIARLNSHQQVLCLLSDCLGADHEGYSPSESSIADNFKREIVSAKGRVLVTSISSNIVRWGQAIESAKSCGRKIVLVGMSVEKAINIARDLGYLKLQPSDIIPLESHKNFPDNKLLFLVAGFSAQPDSALSKIVMGKHKIKIKNTDRVIFSSPDYIPGTTTDIYNLIDTLSRLGAEVAYSEKEELHVTGHGYQHEQAILINLLKPKYLLPIGGNFRHIRSYQLMAKKLGYRDEQIITPEFDQAITFSQSGGVSLTYRVPLKKVLIDGLGIGDVGLTVLRDRKTLAEDGMFSVVLLVNKETGELFKEPVILSRGFVFVKDNPDLMKYLKIEAANKFKQTTSKPANFEFIRTEIQAHLEKIIFDKTGRQPMVLPLVIEV